MVNICTKFREIISNGIKVMDRVTAHNQSMVILLFVPSFVKLSQTVSKLYSGHNIYAGN